MSFRVTGRCCSLLVLLAVCGLACGDEREAEPVPGVTASSASTDTAPPLEADLIEQLSAIGYLAGSELAEPSESADGSQAVVQHDPERVAPGLNLFTSAHAPVALLMNMEGEIVHEWRAEFPQVFPDHPDRDRPMDPHRNFWRDAVLFPNGDLLVIWELFGLFKLDRDSRVIWAVLGPVHHDLQVTQAGEIVHLQAKRRMLPGIPEKRALDDYIVTRDADGVELRRLAISEALHNADWLALRKAFWLRAATRGYGLSPRGLFDPFHTNSLWLLSAAEAARFGDSYRAGDALVSMAMLDTIAILDMEKGEARWWQQGPFGMQHQPHPAPDGGIMLFNNFKTAESSSVLTLDPVTREVSWEYTGPEDAPLYSRRSGGAQVLANGNILIVETDGGRALELGSEGEVVWEFHNPYRTGKDGELIAHLFSLDRVDADRTGWLTR